MDSDAASLIARARRCIPGGVNSPVRAFTAVGADPPCIQRAAGSRLWDRQGREYIDYVCSWGPMILGHAHPRVVHGIREAAVRGTSFGANCEIEIAMAERIAGAVPSVERVRMVSSGTEAAMSAVRLARAFTGRDRIIKFEGCYHGHADSFLSRAGSGAMTLGIPGTPGVTEGAAADTLHARFNDLDSVERLFSAHAGSVAAVIVEPVAGNMGVIPPAAGFLPGLRRLCDRYEAVLIFDEVITGFRLGPGGAQEHYAVIPDMTILGKIIGGGLPVGAFGGRRDIMDMLAPDGPVYQAGTLSGNPLALTSGYETLSIVLENGFYDRLNRRAAGFFSEMESNFTEAGFACHAGFAASMGCFFFTGSEVVDYQSASQADTDRYAAYFRGMLEQGVYLAPSQFEAMFVSSAHTDEDFEQTLAAQRAVLQKIAAR